MSDHRWRKSPKQWFEIPFHELPKTKRQKRESSLCEKKNIRQKDMRLGEYLQKNIFCLRKN
jgi:formyltetrahydrofolate hydrolase